MINFFFFLVKVLGNVGYIKCLMEMLIIIIFLIVLLSYENFIVFGCNG